MQRRAFLRLTLLATAAGGLMGHSPYRQWQAYRKSRLIIVASAAEPAAFPLAETLASVLAEHLPESRAAAARAADAGEVVALLASRQLELAVLSADDARDAYAGRARFAAAGPTQLRALAVFGRMLLVCREDLPAETALAIAGTLVEHAHGDPASATAAIPFHAGVPQPAFEAVARKVVDAFSKETGNVRNVRIDLRRRDTAPDADVSLVGVLGMDIKRAEDPAWYSIRLLFGERHGRWSFLKAYHELPAHGPEWTETAGWYRAVAERALAP